MVTATALLDDLHVAMGALTEGDRHTLRSYFIGALSAELANLPGGAGAWASALETAHDCLGRESA